MSCIQIKQINTLPFRISSEDDTVLVDNLTMDNRMDALKELGYLTDSKTTLVDGTRVYYKGRKNGVYFHYKT